MRRNRRRIPFLLAVVIPLLTIFAISRATAQNSAPEAGAGSAWDSRLGELAGKVAASAPATAGVTLVLNNISSLDGEQAAAIGEALKARLTARHLRIVDGPTAEVSVQVTLSEGVRGYVIVAQIERGADQQTAMYLVPKVPAVAKRAGGVTLEKKLIWRGREGILDFASAPAAGAEGPKLIVLEPERIVFYAQAGGEWKLNQAVPIPPLRPWPRAPQGYVDLSGGTANGVARVTGIDCAGDFGNPSTIQCSLVGEDKQAWGSGAASKPDLANASGETAGVSLACDDRAVTLATGTGDWTQPDTIQAYETGSPEGDAAIVSGTPLEFPGPVMALRADSTGGNARAVTHNLQTDAYEAYVITANCSH